MTEKHRNTSCPMPLAEVRAMSFLVIEPGVRDVVRRLVRIGAHPVWSCEGYPGRVQPEWLWFSGKRSLRSAELYVRWNWPVVICAGNVREMLRVETDRIWGRCELRPCSSIPVHIRQGSSLQAMKHAAPKGSRGWYLLAFGARRLPWR